ncbi:MAG: ADP-forming succinate--CoA ligase subunit beta [Chthonomonadales bacterium]|nr:ADP-forming succinate--CoA ligase subunit beta [Chthonomonadales bacterium]
MKLHEYQAKELLARYGVPVPRNAGAVADSCHAFEAALNLGGKAVLKAQVHTGGRGKAGGIRIVRTPEEAEQTAASMLGMILKTHQAPEGIRVERLLVEEPISVESEIYIGIVPDRASQCHTLIVSSMGGMDIEAVADEHPEAVARERIHPALGLRTYQARRACYACGIPHSIAGAVASVIMSVFKAYTELDADLLEINPLAVVTGGSLVAADAKLSVDDNALFRHPELAAYRSEAAEDPIEAEAQRRGIQYVKLDGTIGVMGNGAGLVMATLDEVARAGGRAANFLDVGGGARAESVRNSLEMVLMNPNVRGVLINIFGGITRCDEVARGVLDAITGMDLPVPIVVRLAGTRADEGARLLADSPLVTADTMQEAASRVVALAG